MTRTVQKISIWINKDGMDPVLEIPGGGHFLSLTNQVYDEYFREDHPGVTAFDTFWAVDTDNVPVEVQLHIRATGSEVPPSVNYLGTFQSPQYAYHVWQKDVIFTDMHIVDGKFVPRSQ